MVHEAGVAVLHVAPDSFYSFSAALFDAQKEFFDVNVVNESRNETYKRLAKLAGNVGIDESKILDELTISDKPGEDGSLNTGNKVTNDLKQLVKVRASVAFPRSPDNDLHPVQSACRCTCHTHSPVQCKFILVVTGRRVHKG